MALRTEYLQKTLCIIHISDPCVRKKNMMKLISLLTICKNLFVIFSKKYNRDKPLALPNVHEKFFSVMKASAYMETQDSSNKETEATSDEGSEANIESDTDENITTFEKYLIRNSKLFPAFH